MICSGLLERVVLFHLMVQELIGRRMLLHTLCMLLFIAVAVLGRRSVLTVHGKLSRATSGLHIVARMSRVVCVGALRWIE
jgi:hypothetical protein